jgi:hypothetical protein
MGDVRNCIRNVRMGCDRSCCIMFNMLSQNLPRWTESNRKKLGQDIRESKWRPHLFSDFSISCLEAL